MTNEKVLWHLRTSFDRKVAHPGETLFATATLHNPNPSPLYIGSCRWKFSCYPKHIPGIKELKKTVPPDGIITIPQWELPIPEIKAGAYTATVSLDTWLWDGRIKQWVNYGTVSPDRGEQFFIIHAPQYRAFISRSSHDIDKPVVEPIISTIQDWGFNTHTVGINEIESDTAKVPKRIVDEIIKADCVFAIATPRDVCSVPNLFRTLAWLDNEVSFSFMAQKPTLLMADRIVKLEGLTSMANIPTIRFSSFDIGSFINYLHEIMPIVRGVIAKEAYRNWQQKRIDEIEKIRFESFSVGMAVRKRLTK